MHDCSAFAGSCGGPLLQRLGGSGNYSVIGLHICFRKMDPDQCVVSSMLIRLTRPCLAVPTSPYSPRGSYGGVDITYCPPHMRVVIRCHNIEGCKCGFYGLPGSQGSEAVCGANLAVRVKTSSILQCFKAVSQNTTADPACVLLRK